MSNTEPGAEVAQAVVNAIQQSGCPMAQVARATGIPYASFRRKIAGETSFRLSELFLIAEAIGTEPARFVAQVNGRH